MTYAYICKNCKRGDAVDGVQKFCIRCHNNNEPDGVEKND